MPVRLALSGHSSCSDALLHYDNHEQGAINSFTPLGGNQSSIVIVMTDLMVLTHHPDFVSSHERKIAVDQLIDFNLD
jgi:hypothetical protein